MNTLFQDLRYALRILAREPTYTAVILITVAIGVGANTAIFSVLNSVLLTRLPYEHPDGIVMVWEHNRPRARLTNVVN
ncbi:MAG: hypothetical protein FJW35_18755, partial [Acidobacteria bacterium]|nr:hypothetical protein [Acidobacteriota bacterium]